MKNTHGYLRAVMLSVVAALLIDMLMNVDAYKAGLAAALHRDNTDTLSAATSYTLEQVGTTALPVNNNVYSSSETSAIFLQIHPHF